MREAPCRKLITVVKSRILVLIAGARNSSADKTVDKTWQKSIPTASAVRIFRSYSRGPSLLIYEFIFTRMTQICGGNTRSEGLFFLCRSDKIGLGLTLVDDERGDGHVDGWGYYRGWFAWWVVFKAIRGLSESHLVDWYRGSQRRSQVLQVGL